MACEWTTYHLKEKVLHYQTPSLECSFNAQSCSRVSWEQNGYCAVQEFLRVSEENVRHIQESFERSPRKSIRRVSRELGIPQPTVWCVLRRRLLFSWVHLFESPCILGSQNMVSHSHNTLNGCRWSLRKTRTQYAWFFVIYRIFSNLIRTSFADFLNEKKKVSSRF